MTSTDRAADPASAPKRETGRPGPRSKPISKLRDIVTSPQCFWKVGLQEYLAQQVRDRTYDSTNDRDLPANEIDCLALNEIAVSERHGYFLFLPSRSSWSHQTYEPKSRGPRPEDLKACVPSLVFMRYAWSTKGRDTFFATSHRSRYLACDFQLNPPPAATPLYCIQVVTGRRYPVFNTSHTSFIMIRADPICFGSMADLAPIIGRPPRKRKGPDAEERLGQVEGCWSGLHNTKFQKYAHADLKGLYEAIIRACHPTRHSSSMSSEHLFQLLPRPSGPVVGLALGQDIMAGSITTRLGGRLVRVPRTEEADANAVEERNTL